MNRISNSQKSRGVSSLVDQYSMTSDVSKGDRLYKETNEIVDNFAKIKQRNENRQWDRDIHTIKKLHWQLDKVLDSLSIEGQGNLFYMLEKDYHRILRLIISFNEYIKHNQLWRLKYAPLSDLRLPERVIIV